jgi:uncharacterized protein YeaO (DUF488 family)
VKTSAKKASRASDSSSRHHEIRIKRVYDELASDDGARFLVDRLWPRGVKKSALSDVTWLRDIAPSAPLRNWFDHDPAKWDEFRKRYRSELEKNSAVWKPLLDAARKGRVTLLFAARDTEMNQAVVLKEFLEKKQKSKL